MCFTSEKSAKLLIRCKIGLAGGKLSFAFPSECSDADNPDAEQPFKEFSGSESVNQLAQAENFVKLSVANPWKPCRHPQSAPCTRINPV